MPAYPRGRQTWKQLERGALHPPRFVFVKSCGAWHPAQETLATMAGLAEHAAGSVAWQLWQRAAIAAKGRGA